MQGIFGQKQTDAFSYILRHVWNGARDIKRKKGGQDGAVVRARLPPILPGFKSRRRRHMGVKFVVCPLPSSESSFSWYSGFPFSSKPIISKIQPGIR